MRRIFKGFFLSALLIFLALTQSHCIRRNGAGKSEPNVYRGRLSTSPDTPEPVLNSTVSVETFKKNTREQISLCSGTLLVQNRILTSGHCCKEDSPNDYEIHFSDMVDPHKRDPKLIRQPVAPPRILNHNRLMAASVDDDLCVLKISDAPSQFVPRPLVGPKETISVDDKVLFAGFGYEKGLNGLGVKRWSPGQVVAISKMLHIHGVTDDWRLVLGPINVAIADIMKRRSNARQGDSGGPVFKLINGQWTVIGATQGAGDPVLRLPFWAVDLRRFSAWIEQDSTP